MARFPTTALAFLLAIVSSTTAITWHSSSDAYWALGCDFNGHDIGSQRVAADMCSNACGRNSGCTHFAWSRFEGGTCWFKRQVGVARSHAISSSKAGIVCGIMKTSSVSQQPATPSRNVVRDSLKFAPIYYFDGKAHENCVPDYATASNNGKCRKEWHNPMPTYVEHSTCGDNDVYTFWLWYGWQNGCFLGIGGRHDNDWEHVSVFVKSGQVQRVIYHLHSEHYTRRRGTFDRTGERPHVYIGKIAHGSYHARCDGKCGFSAFFLKGCLGSVNYCQGGCGYWDDFRNPGRRVDHLRVMDLKRGQTVDGIRRPARSICVEPCEGASTRLLHTGGCWQNKA